jgi:hypothetical protein
MGEIARTNDRSKHVKSCTYNVAILDGQSYNNIHWNNVLPFYTQQKMRYKYYCHYYCMLLQFLQRIIYIRFDFVYFEVTSPTRLQYFTMLKYFVIVNLQTAFSIQIKTYLSSGYILNWISPDVVTRY